MMQAEAAHGSSESNTKGQGKGGKKGKNKGNKGGNKGKGGDQGEENPAPVPKVKTALQEAKSVPSHRISW